MRAGATDFLEKPYAEDALLASVRTALRRDAEAAGADDDVRRINAQLAELTPREREVLDRLLVGRQNKQIAYDLGISPRDGGNPPCPGDGEDGREQPVAVGPPNPDGAWRQPRHPLTVRSRRIPPVTGGWIRRSPYSAQCSESIDFVTRWEALCNSNTLTSWDVVAGTVFIVEDDIGVRDSLLALLQAAGWRTMAFGTGGEVLRCSGTLNEGCLLLDICLPDYDGFEVLTSLRRAGVGLPVIFMTGEERRAEQARAAGIGAFAVLQKPLSEAPLLAAIARAFGDGAAGSA